MSVRKFRFVVAIWPKVNSGYSAIVTFMVSTWIHYLDLLFPSDVSYNVLITDESWHPHSQPVYSRGLDNSRRTVDTCKSTCHVRSKRMPKFSSQDIDMTQEMRILCTSWRLKIEVIQLDLVQQVEISFLPCSRSHFLSSRQSRRAGILPCRCFQMDVLPLLFYSFTFPRFDVSTKHEHELQS